MGDNLFDLIKSLNKNEKGYFKKYISFYSSRKENNYLVLFDALDAMEKYDDEHLCEVLKEESFVKFISRQKNYLYNLILKSIQAYYFESDYDIKLKGNLASIKILYHKGLLNQCEKLLWKTKKLIDGHFLYMHQLEWNRWESKIALAKLDIKKIRQTKEKHLKSVEQLTNLTLYIELYGELYALIMQTGNDIARSRVKQFSKFAKNPLLKSEDRATSLQSKLYYHHILTVYYEAISDYVKAGFHSLKRLQLFEKKSGIINLEPEQYINTLNNRIDILIRLKKYKEAKRLCKTLNGSQFPTSFLNVRKTTRFYLGDFKTSLMLFDFKSIVEESENVRTFISKNESLLRLDEKIQLYFFIAYSLFALGLYKRALQWLNYILNNKDTIQEDFQATARILNLVIHYELGHINYLKYVIKSSVIYIRKRNRFLNSEKIFLQFIKTKLLKTHDKETLAKEFKSIRKRVLEKITTQETKAFSYFNFVDWLESKIEGRTYASILKKNHAKEI